MIIGIGNDLIDIRRVERTLERFGERFVNRIFTDAERAQWRDATKGVIDQFIDAGGDTAAAVVAACAGL